MALSATGTLSATGPGSSVVIRRGFLRISGTWTGTANVQVQTGGTWTDMTDEAGTVVAYTANMSCAIDNAVALPTRVNWTRSSGDLVYFLTGETNE